MRERLISIVMWFRRPGQSAPAGSSLTGYFARSPLDKQVKRSSLSLERPLGCLIKKKNHEGLSSGIPCGLCVPYRQFPANEVLRPSRPEWHRFFLQHTVIHIVASRL